MKIALGTVQFGLKYGVANAQGQVPMAEAARIITRARELGIETLDTAVAYGSSETVLGDIGISGFDVVSKLPPLDHEMLSQAQSDPSGFVERIVTQSLVRLKVPHLTAVLFHRTKDAFGPMGAAMWTQLEKLQATGMIGKLGVSIYDPAELDLNHAQLPLGLVQSPGNAFDTRLEDSGWRARLQKQGTHIHTRSAFLQGLLLMPPALRPAKFNRWDGLWQDWQDWQNKTGLSPLEAALFCTLTAPGTDRVVVGVDSRAQLDAIAQTVETVGQISGLERPIFQGQDADLLTPMTWNSL